jgi:hypothetical protein
MPISFNHLLEAADIDPADVRLLRHKDKRADKGRTPYDLWYIDRPSFELYQSVQNLDNEAKLKAPFWACFLGTPTGDTLFVGLYRAKNKGVLKKDLPKPHMEGVDKAGTCHVYDLAPDERLSDYIGRLFVAWGQGFLAWIQRADTSDKPVIELRRSEYKEPDFPGYLHFIKRLSELDALPTGWVTALRASRGVYLLTCPRTKEQYVGSATGGDGFWGRWQDYASTGHGGNVGLKSHDPSDYQVSILEVAGTAATTDDVLNMESLWKSKLQSKEMGLNKN